jgi:hypothetical protein
LPSAIGAGLKDSSIALVSVHELAPPPESEPPESEDRSATLDVVLSARFTTALVTAFVTALTALFTALVDELLITRKFPLARDTSANPAARDKTPSQIRHLLRTPAESADVFSRDVPEATCRRPCVSMS